VDSLVQLRIVVSVVSKVEDARIDRVMPLICWAGPLVLHHLFQVEDGAMFEEGTREPPTGEYLISALLPLLIGQLALSGSILA
jgi:hypothetical protein